jgi:hypothetical protein
MNASSWLLGASDLRWKSVATDRQIAGQVLLPPNLGQKPRATIVYLKNLSVPRTGQEPDESILSDFVKSGDIVLVLDYARDPKATSPDLNADVLALREAIAGKHKSLLTEYPVDPNHLFIIPEGYRLERDIEFARDGQRILGMDIAYPSHPKKPVGLLMEITCDNTNRMGSFSLLFCHDTLLAGGMIAGFATAMIDHPVAPPYKGLDDPMPQCIYRLKSAVRTARALAPGLGLNGKIGAIGFSRGGPMAALLAATGGRADLEGDGAHQGISSRIQAALVFGNRYDYLHLRADDPMLARFTKAWGARDANRDRWAEHGAIHYLTKDCPPMFLDTSDAESPEYQDGLAKLNQRLDQLGIEHVYQVDKDGRGHRVTTDPKTLARIYEFFGKYLRD